ncbi:hypothetical protein SEA_RIZWANA_50 [Arthrobacter phage Rizwana]|nr:hypothetical protein SEA_RIZWANA_50 [Arthrobacter phage Rizwana]
MNQGDIVRCYPGHRNGRSYIGQIISEGVVKFGGADCVRVQEYSAGRRCGTDYLAVTHVDVLGRVVGNTGYVRTFADALTASEMPLDDIIIEDKAESLKAAKIIKGLRSVVL